MGTPERRRAARLPVDIAGEMFLSDGRRVTVKIKNLGRLGALLQITDLEEPVLEGERAVLDHPRMDENEEDTGERARTMAHAVRVELDFEAEGICRELAVYFDGGPRPEGYVG